MDPQIMFLLFLFFILFQTDSNLSLMILRLSLSVALNEFLT